MGEVSLLNRIVGHLSRTCEQAGERLKVLLRRGSDDVETGQEGLPLQ